MMGKARRARIGMALLRLADHDGLCSGCPSAGPEASKGLFYLRNDLMEYVD